MQPTNDLSVAGQWFWDWKSVRYPESGSYLGFQDALLHGSDSLIFGANPLAAIPGSPPFGRFWHQADADPKKNTDWGISARWSPDWLDGTLGFYYRRTADTQPQLVVKPGVAALSAGFSAAVCSAIGGTPFPPAPTPALCILPGGNTNVADLTQKGRIGNYNLAFGSDIKIYGVSLSKNLGGISFGSEISYRENMPLISDPVTALPTPLVNPAVGQVSTSSLPANDTPGAKGNTWHGLVNALGVLPKTAFFDTMSYAAELTWMMVDKVTQNEAVYKGRPGYPAFDSASKTYFGLAVNMTPTWFQVVPGVDLLAPITWSQGIKGNSAVAAGGSENLGSWSVGLAVDIYNRYRIDLKYIGFFGDYSTNAANVATPIAVSGALVDRNFVNLTFKTTF
jgi:hypothetical protein